VPEWLRGLVPPGVTAYVFGTVLGLGFLTRYTYSAHAVMAVGVALLPPRQMLLGCFVYAVFKGLVLVATPKRVSIPSFSDTFDRRFFFRRHGIRALRLGNIAVACVGLTLVLASLI
jgi:hypothetical protein